MTDLDGQLGIGDVTTPAQMADLLAGLIGAADGELAYGGQWGRAVVEFIKDRAGVSTLEVDVTRALYDRTATSPYDHPIEDGGRVRRFTITITAAEAVE